MIVIAGSDPKLINRWSEALGGKYASYAVSQKTALVRAMSSLKPRLLILDVGLPRLRAVKELPELQKLSPLTKILVISASPTISEGVSVLKAGAKGYYSQKISSDLLNKALRAVLNNELWAGRKILSALIEEIISERKHKARIAKPNTALDDLTGRKRQIAALVIEGSTNKAIAKGLNISEATVKAHLSDIFRKFHLSGRLQLAILLAAQAIVE